MELTLNDIQEYLGQTGKKQGSEVSFSCPLCNALGRDRHGDNLKFNTTKSVLYCFCDDTHSGQILSEIMKKKHEEKKMSNVEIPKYHNLQTEYVLYQQLCNDMLLGKFNEAWIDEMVALDLLTQKEGENLKQIAQTDKPHEAREYLKRQRGINSHTIELTGLGFDFNERRWVIPIFDMDCNIVGFEYRVADFKTKKIWRERGSVSCLARTYGNGRKALIFEGFLDSYCALQMANSKEELSLFTTSSGVAGLTKVITQLQFGSYDSITLILDNDEPANKITKEIIEKYPFIKDGRQFLIDSGCKDVNEYMLKVVNND